MIDIPQTQKGYEEIAKLTEQLHYRDKFRLAQLLIQVARKEEEAQSPQQRDPITPETVPFVAERLNKLKPAKRATLLNSIAAMFQFQGGVSEADKERIVDELQKQGFITIAANDRVTYTAS